MAITKDTLRFRLSKENIQRVISNDYAWCNNIECSVPQDTMEQLMQTIGNFSAYLTDKHLEEGKLATDFLYLAPLYTQNTVHPTNILKFPNIALGQYKGLLHNVTVNFISSYYRRVYPFYLAFVSGNVFIGRGIILDKSLHPLIAIKGDIERSGDNVKFSNPYCIIDKKIFNEKNQVNTFIKNTFFPTLIELGYRVEIDDFSHTEIFEHPIPPQSYEIDADITKVLTDNIDNMYVYE